MDCMYYDIDELKKLVMQNHNYEYTQIHLIIRSLPAKHDHLKTFVSELDSMGLNIDFIMLCETFLNDTNMNMYQIQGYQFISNNRVRGKGGGVALYIRDKFHITKRADLTLLKLPMMIKQYWLVKCLESQVLMISYLCNVCIHFCNH